MLDNYKHAAKVFAPLLKSDNEQSGLEIQKSDDDQADAADMSGLESKESAGQGRNQQGTGLKFLTPSQMLSKLSISLAQLNARNNSEKLKNEIRQLLYSLYRS